MAHLDLHRVEVDRIALQTEDLASSPAATGRQVDDRPVSLGKCVVQRVNLFRLGIPEERAFVLGAGCPAEPAPAEALNSVRRADMPTPEEASMLQLDNGTPIFAVRRIAYSTEGRAVEMNDMRLSGDKYELAYEFPAG
ncbi:UTRA domain-containing protein [Amycolatopsis thailandensis]|uniref:UTRA domain-containing protein n=1 Tax=Amycolatopsis thailandensis TaxID=589330 RepID=UPI003647C3E6